MKKVITNKKEFKKEHKHLLKVLMGGTKKERIKEAHKQKKELKSK